MVGHHGVTSGLLLTFLNLSEALLSALLLRHRSSDLPDFTNPSFLARFILFGVFAGPVAMGAVDCLIAPFWHAVSPLWHTQPALSEFLQWVAADALGACVVTPACVAIFRTRFRDSLFSLKNWFYLLPVVACAVAAFCQPHIPIHFFLYPLLVLVLLRLGLGWAALATLLVAAVASSFTVRGLGPFAVSSTTSPLESAALSQLFIASAMVVLYSVSVVLAALRTTEQRLQEVLALHRLVTDNSRDVLIIADFEGNRSFVSASGADWGGWSKEELQSIKSLDLVHPKDKARIAGIIQQLRAGADGALAECRVRKHDGSYVWIEASLRAIRDQKTGKPTGLLNCGRDISERKQAEDARQLQHSLLEAIHEVLLDGILVVDEHQNVISCNQRFAEVWSINLPESLPGNLDKSHRVPGEGLFSQAMLRLKDPKGFLKRVEEVYANPAEKDHCELQLRDGKTLERNSTCLRNKDGKYLGRVWFFRDITGHKLAEQRLQEAYRAVETLAATDALTGLANRRRFNKHFALEWRRCLRDCLPLSLLLIDADHFKSYNDTYGHLRGDGCLKEIADVAHSAVARPGDLVARIGGEEFAAILPNTDPRGAFQIAQAVCVGMCEREIPHSSNPFGVVTVSVGCATVVPQLGQHTEFLIERADNALYQAKRTGRNRACSGEPEKVSDQDASRSPNLITRRSA
jgi:diguanylate cyclase (GGDEF)-like protein/PAS domain S-box-containing protein